MRIIPPGKGGRGRDAGFCQAQAAVICARTARPILVEKARNRTRDLAACRRMQEPVFDPRKKIGLGPREIATNRNRNRQIENLSRWERSFSPEWQDRCTGHDPVPP